MRPLDLPPADRFPHGSRSRYVTGCRCTPCRSSNTAYYHQRQARAQALAAELPPPPETPAPQLWTAPDGSKRTRVYQRACPGVHGEPRALRSHLRKDSKGGCCRACREKLVWNGLVSADQVRAHLRRLSRQGVGRRAVGDASDVAESIIGKVRSGRGQVRASTARRLLAIDAGAAADHARVDARPTWERIRELTRAGYPKARLAKLLGYTRLALQLGRKRVLARTALRVEKLHRELLAEA